MNRQPETSFYPELVVQRFVQVARPIMLRFMRVNSCISAARVTTLVMEQWGISSEVVAVRLVVQCANKQFAYTSGYTDEELRKMAPHAASITQTYRDTVKGWTGHLVVVAAGHLIDCTLDQAHSEEHHIWLTNGVFACELTGDNVDALRAGELGMRLVVDNDETQTLDDIEVRYMPLVDDSWRETEAWNEQELVFLAAMISRAMKGADA